MSPTQKGAFCQKCALEVYDVSAMTNRQIRGLLYENLGKRTCVNMTREQEVSMNEDFTQWQLSNKENLQRAMLFSLLVVFGLSLFSCNNPQQVKELQDLQSIAASVVPAAEVENDFVEESIEIEVKNQKTPSSNTTEIEQPLELHSIPIKYNVNNTIEDSIVDLPPIEVFGNSREGVQFIGMLGGIGMTTEYKEFIVDEIENSDASVEKGHPVPSEFSALAFPNPVISSTRLEVQLPENTKKLEVTLIDLNGKVLKKVSNSRAEAGTHHFEIDMHNLNPAVYLIDVRYNNSHEVVRVVKAD